MWKRSTSFLKKLRPCQTYVTQTFLVWRQYITAQKMKFTITDFFSKCDQICRIWSDLLKKSLMENFIFYAVNIESATFNQGKKTHS